MWTLELHTGLEEPESAFLTRPTGNFCPLSPNCSEECCPVLQSQALRLPEKSLGTHIKNREEPGSEAGLTAMACNYSTAATDFTETKPIAKRKCLLCLPRVRVS